MVKNAGKYRVAGIFLVLLLLAFGSGLLAGCGLSDPQSIYKNTIENENASMNSGGTDSSSAFNTDGVNNLLRAQSDTLYFGFRDNLPVIISISIAIGFLGLWLVKESRKFRKKMVTLFLLAIPIVSMLTVFIAGFVLGGAQVWHTDGVIPAGGAPALAKLFFDGFNPLVLVIIFLGLNVGLVGVTIARDYPKVQRKIIARCLLVFIPVFIVKGLGFFTEIFGQ